MDDQQNDINLLPDDLRKAEEKNINKKAADDSTPRTEFHIPEPLKPSKGHYTPARSAAELAGDESKIRAEEFLPPVEQKKKHHPSA